MPQETFPGISRHFDKMIPMQLVGITADKSQSEVEIGTFNAGVVMHGTTLTDVLTREIIGSYSMRDNSWVVTKGRTMRYRYIFIQVQPQE